MQNTMGPIDRTKERKANLSADAVQAIENDREFKAHIYQQLVDIQPLLSPDSQVAVLVQLEQGEDADDTEYVLTLVTTLGDYRLEAEGRSDNVYDSFANAKSNLVHQLDDVYGAAIDETDREVEIEGLLNGSMTLH